MAITDPIESVSLPLRTAMAINAGMAMPPPIPKQTLAHTIPQKPSTHSNEKTAHATISPPATTIQRLLILSAKNPMGT